MTTVGGGTLKLSNSLALQNSVLTPAYTVTFDSAVNPHAFIFGGLNGTNGLALADNANNAVSLTVGNNNTSSNYGGVLSSVNTSSGTLTKTGSGTFTATANNTFGGPLNLNGGVFSTNNINTVGTAQGMGQGNTINFNGGTFLTTGTVPNQGDSGSKFGPNIVVGASGGTLSATGGGLWCSSVFSGSGPLTFINNNWLMSGTSPSYTGNVNIGNAAAGGFIQLRSSSASILGTGTVTINPGGTLSADAGTTSPSALANPIVLNGGSLITQGPNMNYSGPITVANGTTSSVGWGYNGGGWVTLSGNISGSGTVTTIGAAAPRVMLSGTNSAFAGTWQTTGEPTYFNSAAAGSVNALWQINGSTFLANIAGNNTISLGALSGSSGGVRNFLAGSTATFSVAQLNTSTTFSGVMDNYNGTTALTKVGSGGYALSGASIIYTGPTNISTGTLGVQDTTAFASPIAIGANGTLNVARTALGFANRSPMLGGNNSAITGSGVINVNSTAGTSGLASGWAVVTGANAMNVSGVINVNSGVFGTDSAGVVSGSAIVNVAANAVLTNHSSAGFTIGALNGARRCDARPSGHHKCHLQSDRRRRKQLRFVPWRHPRQQHERDRWHDGGRLAVADQDRQRHANPRRRQHLHRRDRHQRRHAAIGRRHHGPRWLDRRRRQRRRQRGPGLQPLRQPICRLRHLR